MSNSKKSKKTSPESGVAVLETRPEAAILGHIGAAAGELMLRRRARALAPSSAPISEPVRESEPDTIGAAVWQRGRRFTALWGKSEERNSWVAVQGIGWKKLSTASDSANIVLTALASHALQTARNVDYREESDGMIHEIYVW